MTHPCILVVDDREDIRISARFFLEDNEHRVLEADSPEQAKIMLRSHGVDLILLDMNYHLDTTSGDEGLQFLSWLSQSSFQLPVIAMTAWSNVDLAVKAMQLGATDFIEKPWKNQRLLQIIKQQLSITELKKQNQQLKQRLESQAPEAYVWRSPCMLLLLEQLGKIAATQVTVLLTGDNGTGKSQLAREIHQQSASNKGPFIGVNMGALAENLFESEMFGHKKGAFTDAKSSRIGRFELAKNGTLFLDEIANIPLSQQVKLLRVLESGEYEPLGSSHTQTANVRIISASNGDFDKLIGQERFREDLFYRLNTLEFRVPSLKERSLDIIPLAQHFITLFTHKYQRDPITLGESAKQALQEYHWPGNIRELSHLMERAVLLVTHCQLNRQDLQLSTLTQRDGNNELPMMTLEQAEKRLLCQALEHSENNIPKAASVLGLTKSSMYRRLEKYDLQ